MERNGRCDQSAPEERSDIRYRCGDLTGDTKYTGVIAEHVKWLPKKAAAPDPAIDIEQRKADIQKLAVDKDDGKWVRLRKR